MRHILPLAVFAALAGCAGEPADPVESADGLDPACGPYETLPYERAPESAALREAFERAGYAWTPRTDRIAEATGPQGGTLVLSHQPGASGDDLVLSAEGAQAHRLAVAGSAIVNFTSEEARLREWTAGNSC